MSKNLDERSKSEKLLLLKNSIIEKEIDSDKIRRLNCVL